MRNALSIVVALVITAMTVAAAQAQPSPVERIIAQEDAKSVSQQQTQPSPVERIIAQEDAKGVSQQQTQPSPVERIIAQEDAKGVSQLRTQPADGRSPDTIDAAVRAQLAQQAADLRSPDTRDAAEATPSSPTASVIIVDKGGFDWSDAGIGAAGGFAIALLLAGGIALTHRNSKGRLIV